MSAWKSIDMSFTFLSSNTASQYLKCLIWIGLMKEPVSELSFNSVTCYVFKNEDPLAGISILF